MAVSVNPPKTPVTTGSKGVASATIPNVCKMPGPPAPFVLTALPSVGRTGDAPKGYSTSVKIEGKKVAIKGASFGTKGDMASKATGGGLVSANAHGPAKFVGPGSMNVKIEGKNVQLLGDPVLNNCGPSGSPANAATIAGVIQPDGRITAVEAGMCALCGEEHKALEETEATKTSAGNLATNFKAELKATAFVKQRESMRAVTMLGVTECKCGKKYADQSGMTTVEFCRAAAASGMKHHQGVFPSYGSTGKAKKQARDHAQVRVEMGLKSHFGSTGVFGKAWEQAAALADKSDARRLAGDPNQVAAYPPGNCAGPSALLLLLDDGALVAAMTEEWYHSGHGKTTTPVFHIDNTYGHMMPTTADFNHGDTVPPCKTCNIIMPLILCTQGKTSCSHKT